MAKISAPLLSFTGSGQIAKTQVYGTWKGRPYARRYVVPANPQSTGQMQTRDVFSWLNSVWKVAPADFQAPWQAFAKGKVLTDRNAWLSKNVSNLRTATDLTGLVMSPGAAGGLNGPITITPAAGQLTIAGTAPAPLPGGWSIIKLVGVAIRNQDPHTGVLFDISSGEDVTSPYSVVLTGLAAASWWAAGWFVFQKSASASDLAYGAATAAEHVVT